MVVSTIFFVHPYLGKIPILANIFQMGWNRQQGMCFLPNFYHQMNITINRVTRIGVMKQHHDGKHGTIAYIFPTNLP